MRKGSYQQFLPKTTKQTAFLRIARTYFFLLGFCQDISVVIPCGRLPGRAVKRKPDAAVARSRILCSSLAIVLAAATGQAASPLSHCDRTIAEAALRKEFVTQFITPAYPADSVKAGVTGVVVAQVCVGAGSKSATAVKILTAPDKAIGRSVEQALAKWRFAPFWEMGDPSHLYSYSSKITFYFVKQPAGCSVLSPTDQFYVGPYFALKERGITTNSSIERRN